MSSKLLCLLLLLALILFASAQTDTQWFKRKYRVRPGAPKFNNMMKRPQVRRTYKMPVRRMPIKPIAPKPFRPIVAPQHPVQQPNHPVTPAPVAHPTVAPLLVVKQTYPFKKAVTNFTLWWKRNSVKNEFGKTPKPKAADVKVWWTKKSRPNFLDINFVAVARHYRKAENKKQRRVQRLLGKFKKWFARQQKKDAKGKLVKPLVADMHTWWSKRLAPGKKPNLDEIFDDYLNQQRQAKINRRIRSFKIWWYKKSQDPKKKPTIYDLKAWWADELKAQKKNANKPLPNFYFLYKKLMKRLEFMDLVQGLSQWWSKYGRRNKFKKLLRPKIVEVKNWFGKRTQKVSLARLRNKYWTHRKRHFAKMSRLSGKFIAFWNKSGKKGVYPVEQDVKNWYLTLGSASFIQPNFTKLLKKILLVLEVRRNKRLAEFFLKWWKTSAPFVRKVVRRGRKTTRILVRRSTATVYDLKAWWTSNAAKKKQSVSPDFNKVWVRVQLLLARRTRKVQQSKFKSWWATYVLKKFKGKKAKSMKKRPTPKFVKWWMNKMKIKMINIKRWLKRFKRAQKKRSTVKKAKKAFKSFTNWWKKQGKKTKPTKYDIKAWWAVLKTKKPYLKRPNFGKLLLFFGKFKKIGKCVGNFKKFLKSRVAKTRPTKKFFVNWWKSHKKAKVQKTCIAVVLKKIAKRRTGLLLKAFHKWWRAEMNKRNSPKFTDATVADFKKWWNTRKIKSPQPNFWRLVAIYNRKINLKRNILAFLKYWKNTGISRKPYVYDLRAWWRRIMKQTRLRKPHFGVMIRHILAKLAGRSFKVSWEVAKNKVFPVKKDVYAWKKTVAGKGWRTSRKLIWKYVFAMFLLEKRLYPERMLRTYPELRTVHRELIKLHMKKSRTHQTIVAHREATRIAYVNAVANLKAKQVQLAKDKKELKLAELALNFQRPKTQKAQRQYEIARNNLQKSFYAYDSARKQFQKAKKAYFAGTKKRRTEYFSLEGKLKALRLLIGLVGPQHHIRVMRKCEVKRITPKCTQQICCNVRYLADLNGQKQLGKEYCQLQGSMLCK